MEGCERTFYFRNGSIVNDGLDMSNLSREIPVPDSEINGEHIEIFPSFDPLPVTSKSEGIETSYPVTSKSEGIETTPSVSGAFTDHDYAKFVDSTYDDNKVILQTDSFDQSTIPLEIVHSNEFISFENCMKNTEALDDCQIKNVKSISPCDACDICENPQTQNDFQENCQLELFKSRDVVKKQMNTLPLLPTDEKVNIKVRHQPDDFDQPKSMSSQMLMGEPAIPVKYLKQHSDIQKDESKVLFPAPTYKSEDSTEVRNPQNYLKRGQTPMDIPSLKDSIGYSCTRKNNTRAAAMELLQQLHKKFAESLLHKVSNKSLGLTSHVSGDTRSDHIINDCFNMSVEEENVSLTANSIQKDMVNTLKLTEYRPVSPFNDDCNKDNATGMTENTGTANEETHMTKNTDNVKADTNTGTSLKRKQSDNSLMSPLKVKIRLKDAIKNKCRLGNSTQLKKAKLLGSRVESKGLVRNVMTEKNEQPNLTSGSESTNDNESNEANSTEHINTCDQNCKTATDKVENEDMFCMDVAKLVQLWESSFPWFNEYVGESEVQNAAFYDYNDDVIDMLSDKSLYVWQLIENI